MERFEAWMYETLSNAKKQRLILLLTLLAFVASLMLFPTKLVLAKMLPGKSTNTFSIYVDLPSGS